MGSAGFVIAVMWLGLFALVLGLAAFLARPKDRPLATLLVAGGLCASLFKIWLFQQAPQWHGINPDSITYDLNAKAFALHWQGKPVDAFEYNLRGLKVWHEAGLHDPVWQPHDHLSYASIMGSHEWLYAAYVGLWYWLAGASQNIVIYSNAIFAAFCPAAAFGLAAALGARRKVALLAGGLALRDPSAGVNASWLLKDTLVRFLAMAGLWAGAQFPELRQWRLLAVLALLAGLLGISRYVAFFALLVVLLLVVAVLLKRREWKPAAAIAISLVGSWVIAGLLHSAPQVTSTLQVISTPANAIEGSHATLLAQRGDPAADDTVLRWKESLRANPMMAVVKSIAHTLFAPYPWVALYPGLTYRSFSELYYPGVVLWIMCLPGIAWALWCVRRSNKESFWLVATFLVLLLIAYTVFQGEWSTRQRVFALPAFFALAAIGWVGLSSRLGVAIPRRVK